MILDTTFLIDLLENDDGAFKKIRELETNHVLLATTAVTVFELWRGFSALNQDKMEQASLFLENIRVYDITPESGKVGGRIAQGLDRIGATIDPEDAMIAGVALVKKEEVLTRNTKHFGRIQGLVVATY